jgi:hypothetical protein
VELALACLAADLEQRPRNAGAVAASVAGWRAGVEERARSAESAAVAARARADVSQAHAERQQALAARAKAEAERQQALAAQAEAAAVQQRVRASAEQARAEQERRARRLTLGVAALGAAVLTTAAIGWRMVGDERSQRALETMRAVEGALGEAAALADAAGQSDARGREPRSQSPGDLGPHRRKDRTRHPGARPPLGPLEEEARISVGRAAPAPPISRARGMASGHRHGERATASGRYTRASNWPSPVEPGPLRRPWSRRARRWPRSRTS